MRGPEWPRVGLDTDVPRSGTPGTACGLFEVKIIHSDDADPSVLGPSDEAGDITPRAFQNAPRAPTGASTCEKLKETAARRRNMSAHAGVTSARAEPLGIHAGRNERWAR